MKDRPCKTSGWQFHSWLFGPEKVSGLSGNGLQVRVRSGPGPGRSGRARSGQVGPGRLVELSADVRPLPKLKPARSVEKDIRPISLTCQVAKMMESFTLARLLPVLLDKLDLKQFALSGRSTTQALVCLLHLALEALDIGNCALCFFFADFKKGFDLIDHRTLLRKLSGFGLHLSLVRWVAAF